MSKSKEDSKPAADDDRRLNEEYKIWKQNTPFMYDLVITDVLEWPSMTVQWLPERTEVAGKDYSVHKLILGTYAGDKPNYLMIAEVQLPTEDAERQMRVFDVDHGEIGAFEGARGKSKVCREI